LRTQQVRAVVWDEAQHLMPGGTAATPLDQRDWLKSMTNVTGVLHVLLGTSSLVHFCHLNGPTARRGLEIHCPRYHGHVEPDGQALRNVLLPGLTQGPLTVNRAALLQPWPYCSARSLGCVGGLKEWLVRAIALALRDESGTLTLAHLERRALAEAQCARMAADIQDGAQTLCAPEPPRHRLLALLGMREMPSLTSGTATPLPSAELAHAESPGVPPPPRLDSASARVGLNATRWVPWTHPPRPRNVPARVCWMWTRMGSRNRRSHRSSAPRVGRCAPRSSRRRAGSCRRMRP
jgi:hypothetical protein